MRSRLVAVGMSGGVDSTVAALLLKRQGYSVMGVHMQNWDELDESGHCSSESDFVSVQEICAHIKIPCLRVNFVKEYWNEVFSYFLSEIQNGRTPNPDIICNKKVKFNSFYDFAVNDLGAWKIASGHYARVTPSTNGKVQLLQALDKFKDQTYFLSHVPQRVLFPIGHLIKSKVRQLAREAGLSWVADKRESMGLCFIGRRDFSKFVGEYIEDSRGNFVTLSGEVVGRHRGHHYYTVGQRARLGGKKWPYFVCGKDPVENVVTVAEGSNHPALYTHSFTTLAPHWISHDPFRESCDLAVEEEVRTPDRNHIHSPDRYSTRCAMRFRHQQPLRTCTIHQLNSNHLEVCCDEAMRAVTPGQFAVFYDGEQCLGGACIDTVGPSLYMAP